MRMLKHLVHLNNEHSRGPRRLQEAARLQDREVKGRTFRAPRNARALAKAAGARFTGGLAGMPTNPRFMSAAVARR
jgi:hypothetical protein